MKVIADFRTHSRFAMVCSPNIIHGYAGVFEELELLNRKKRPGSSASN